MKAIEFEHVSKIYKLYFNEKKRLASFFSKRIPYQEKKALSDISFSIEKGESVAILGKNGAGKSTILKMITGVTYPTSGDVRICGTVGALLELNVGFDKEFTGRENIYLKGHILGLKNSEITAIEEQIIEFADIAEYIDQPLRTYSSGMKARLGFSINVHITPDILVIDEALSVGDEEFKLKCLDKIRSLTSQYQITLIFVTHSISMAKDFCSRGIVIENGCFLFDGDIDSAITCYTKTIKK